MPDCPGRKLRSVRESLDLTLRDVAKISAQIALRHQDPRFAVSFIRLFRIETKELVPTLHHLYSLAVVYRRDCREMLEWYGVNLDTLPDDLKLGGISVTHPIENGFRPHLPLAAPVSTATSLWPVTIKGPEFGFLYGKGNERLTYACVGTQDFTMYPLIPPGSFLQIDQSLSSIARKGWRSEYERPVYFVETRKDGFRIGWCSIMDGMLTIQPHPLSAAAVRSYRHPREAEIVGQVVAVSMRLVSLAGGNMGPLPTRVRSTEVSSASISICGDTQPSIASGP